MLLLGESERNQLTEEQAGLAPNSKYSAMSLLLLSVSEVDFLIVYTARTSAHKGKTSQSPTCVLEQL